MATYSQDLRDRALAALRRGEPVASICRRLEVGRQWVYDVRDRFVMEGDRASHAAGGCRVSRVAGCQDVIRGWLAVDPGLTLKAVCERLARECRIRIQPPALWNQMDQWGLSLKKNPARQRARATRRAAGPSELADPAASTGDVRSGVSR
ncbi:MAG: helix-turn-helix domain-containing protein [Panacagrimonas sp.]